MPKPTQATLLAAFKKADKDGNGKLNLRELKQVVIAFADTDEEKREAGEMAQQIMDLCDDNEDRELNYEELLQLLLAAEEQEQDERKKLKTIFKAYDYDHTGEVVLKVLMRGLRSMHIGVPIRLEAELAKVDKDGDGLINFEEFLAFWDILEDDRE